jgi:hypothetical protein
MGPRLGAVVVFTLLAAAPARADDPVLSGESTTMVRGWASVNKQDLYPAYEYLHFSATDLDRDGSLSFHFGGWGRVDLDKRSTDAYNAGDFQYGYFNYHAPKNNLSIDVGRQFVSEGVASEKLDGLHVRSDLIGGFGVAGYVGSPVVTSTNSQGGELIYGGRLSQGVAQLYSIGVSALQVTQSGEQSTQSSSSLGIQRGDRFRQEEGADIWLHPVQQLDLVGHSNYNSITDGWMEHDYKLSYLPYHNFSISVGYSNINYKDYFYHMTSNVFSLMSPSNPTGVIDPNEKVKNLGASISYTPIQPLNLVGDYKHYDYEIAGYANYFGGKATFSLPESLVTGFAIHRMDGTTDKLCYNEYRVFVSKKVYRFNLTGDFLDVHYDNPINGMRGTYTAIAAASTQLSSNLKVAADVHYSRNPIYDNQWAGLVKLTYVFNTRRSNDGRAM